MAKTRTWRKGTFYTGLGVIILLLIPVISFSQSIGPAIPHAISYQGYLTDSGGNPVDTDLSGPLQMIFTIYNHETAGTSLWAETQDVTVKQGVYSVVFGADAANPLTAPFNVPYYLEVQVETTPGTFETLSPRQPLTAVPYALNADMVDGKHNSDFAALSHSHTESNISNLTHFTAADETDPTVNAGVKDGVDWTEVTGIPSGFADGVDDTGSADSDWNVVGNDMHSAVPGNVGIGTPTPNHLLEVVGSENTALGWFLNENIETGNPTGIYAYGNALGTDTGEGVGAYFKAAGGSTGGNAFASKHYAYASGTAAAFGVYSDADGGSTTGSEWAFYGKGDGYFSGKVGIGTATPGAKLSVETGSDFAITGENTTSGNTGSLGGMSAGVEGTALPGGSVGVKGTNTVSGNMGYLGGSQGGVQGYSSNADEYAIMGLHFGNSDHSPAIFGKHVQGGYGIGVQGEGGYVGVSGEAFSLGFGGLFKNTWSGGVGIYALGGPNGYSAILRGNVLIQKESDGSTVIELGEGLDYAEGFDVSDGSRISAGTVLVIDAANPGKLAVSRKAYDTRVAGIVAGAKGLGSGVRLGGDQFGSDVALAGRVYCNVDATEAGIEPGDLLTTASLEGYAMKVTDHSRANGAILGKAMEGMEKGSKGQILVLVTLQ